MIKREKNVRKLTSVGRGFSLSVVIPIEILDELGWRAKQKVVLKRYGKGVIIKDWKKKTKA